MSFRLNYGLVPAGGLRLKRIPSWIPMSWALFITYQMEETRLKQGGSIWIRPIRNNCFSFPLQNVFLMNMTQDISSWRPGSNLFISLSRLHLPSSTTVKRLWPLYDYNIKVGGRLYRHIPWRISLTHFLHLGIGISALLTDSVGDHVLRRQMYKPITVTNGKVLG
jgi:hypothetical protein